MFTARSRATRNYSNSEKNRRSWLCCVYYIYVELKSSFKTKKNTFSQLYWLYYIIMIKFYLLIYFIFRLTRSDMNCQRVKYILRGLSNSDKLESLDFSHCKIANEGVLSIAKFIARHANLRNLYLVDNSFGWIYYLLVK